VIVFVSCALAAYEALAAASKKRTVSDYSHTWPYGILVWGWLMWLTAHFVLEARKSRC
jgi:hypothetical protein